MTRHRDIRLMFYDYLRNELSDAERSAVQAHVEKCAKCKLELQSIQEALDCLPVPSTHPSEQRTEEFWTTFAARTVEKAVTHTSGRSNVLVETIEWLEDLFQLHPRYGYSIAGGCVALVIGFALWTLLPTDNHKLAHDRVPLNQQSIEPVANETPAGEQVIPVERVNQYFRKSKMLLVGLKSLKSDVDEPVDFSAEQRLSRDLIQEARYLEQQPIDPRSRRLIKDLDKILIELKNIGEHGNAPDIEIIRGGIHTENLLFKIRMAEAMYDSTNFITANERR